MRHSVRLTTLAALALPFAAAGAQHGGDLAARADAAWQAGERARADSLYAAIVARDSSSRALYRLAMLRRDRRPADAERLLRAYVAREPGDAWGHLALGESHLRAGRLRSAQASLDRAAALAPDAPDVAQRRRQLALRLAPTLEPVLAGSEDSDRNQALRAGLSLSRQAGDVARFRAEGGVKRVSDVAGWASTGDAQVGFRLAPRAGLQLDLMGGATILGAPADTVVRYVTVGSRRRGLPPITTAQRIVVDGGTTAIATGLARLRWRGAGAGPSLTLGARRTALDATPLLVASQVARTEAKGEAELPLAGPLRLRAGGALARLDSRVDVRTRRAADLALVARTRPWLELSVQGHTLGVDSATTAGWFAPRRADVAELGASVEREWDNGVSLSLDAGAGAQRVRRFDAAMGDWTRALRLWGSVGRALAPGRGVRLEVEAYDSLLGSVAGTAEGWRYASVSLGGWVAFR